MKKGLKFIMYLSIQVLALGLMGFFGTYLSDVLSDNQMFGDYKAWSSYDKESYTAWGARHYWYFWTVFILCLIQVARIIMFCVSFWDQDAKKILD